MSNLSDHFNAIIKTPHTEGNRVLLGYSREHRPLWGYTFGSGSLHISLIAGAHADEPVGPLLLDRLASYLSSLPPESPLLADYSWSLVPHANPDGDTRNAPWQNPVSDHFCLGSYLKYVVREAPGDDIEFGFPVDEKDRGARPENIALWNFLREQSPIQLHGSLHGMGFAAGPWFLLDPSLDIHNAAAVISNLSKIVADLGYTLHDVERGGEKGFVRIAKGFATRPNVHAMKTFFRSQEDEKTAALFRPTSMDAITTLNPNTLTFVSEMPLFILPDVGISLGPPDPAMASWQKRILRWKEMLSEGSQIEYITKEALGFGLLPMPLIDQLQLQWCFICEMIAFTEERLNYMP